MEVCENDRIEMSTEAQEPDWKRIEPPKEWPPAAGESDGWPYWLKKHDSLVKRAFDSRTPLFTSIEDEECPMVLVIREACFDAQILHPHAHSADNRALRFDRILRPIKRNVREGSLPPFADGSSVSDSSGNTMYFFPEAL
jgi:hypothetical protein